MKLNLIDIDFLRTKWQGSHYEKDIFFEADKQHTTPPPTPVVVWNY
jgi:hypothetical protein